MRHAPLLLLAACTAAPPEIPEGAVDLRAAFGTTDDVSPVGIAVAATGERYVFDEARGLFRIDGSNGVPVVAMAAMPQPATPVRPPYTDLAMLAPNVFAVTALGDGFVLDTAANTLTQHFCYEPGGLPDALVQRTDALAYDAEQDVIYAQPLTYDEAGVYQYSDLAAYQRSTGAAIQWYRFATEVKATGMIAMPGRGLVLGEGSLLSRFDAAASATVPLDDLARFGVRRIDGLALTPAGDTLLVVDGANDALVEIPLAELEL